MNERSQPRHVDVVSEARGPQASDAHTESWWQRLRRCPDGTMRPEPVALTYYTLLVCTLILLVIGLAMVFSVQSVTVASSGGNAYAVFARYLIIAVVGLVGMIIASHVSIRVLDYLTLPLLAIGMALQCLVFVPGLSRCAGGNCNWIAVPVIGTAQPSEFIKLALALYIGWALSRHAERFHTVRGTLLILSPAAVAVMLVLGGGDLGTVVIMVMLMAGALWIGGLGKGWFLFLSVAGLCGFTGATWLSHNRRQRIIAWIHPDSADNSSVGYQPLHGRYALGTGGWGGVGPGSSRQKWGYLTQADSDYIFAVLGEEAGLVGTLAVIVLFAVIGWCCLRMMRRTNDMYVKVVTAGLMSWIVGQALVNMSVVVGLLPVLGVPLPLISAGGSSLIVVLAAIGVLLSFARHEPGAREAFAAGWGAMRRSLSVVSSRRRNRG